MTLFDHPLPNISSRLMETKETIRGNMKKSVLGCWAVKPRCDPPEEHSMFASLKMPLTFREPYMPGGGN